MSLSEIGDQADLVVVTEANRTHTGDVHAYEIADHEAELAQLVPRGRFVYLPADISYAAISGSAKSSDHHHNEWLTRNAFVDFLDLSPDDLVIALDADEIVYSHAFPAIWRAASRRSPLRAGVRLPMHQFYYRVNLLWEDMVFTSAVAGRVRYLGRQSRGWRDSGRRLKEVVGCHFSWQLTTDQMLRKLQTYAHRSDYAHLASAEILEQAVRERTYPFDPSRAFTLRRIREDEHEKFYPRSISSVRHELAHLID
jgi:hypothetical protein